MRGLGRIDRRQDTQLFVWAGVAWNCCCMLTSFHNVWSKQCFLREWRQGSDLHIETATSASLRSKEAGTGALAWYRRTSESVPETLYAICTCGNRTQRCASWHNGTILTIYTCRPCRYVYIYIYVYMYVYVLHIYILSSQVGYFSEDPGFCAEVAELNRRARHRLFDFRF